MSVATQMFYGFKVVPVILFAAACLPLTSPIALIINNNQWLQIGIIILFVAIDCYLITQMSRQHFNFLNQT